MITGSIPVPNCERFINYGVRFLQWFGYKNDMVYQIAGGEQINNLLPVKRVQVKKVSMRGVNPRHPF